ncbi:MAG: nucleoside-diphosphate-sugar epimerase [Verrucomicrobiales bacterium]|jgi:nucleoside-diphosphate-sugar epimerase
MQAVADRGGKRVGFVSSIAVYRFPDHGRIDETLPVNTEQSDPYGRTQAQVEERGFALAEQLGL